MYFTLFTVANTTPLLKDLYEHIAPHYAADWRVIGTLLGLPIEELKIIQYDNYHKAVPCCNAVFLKWLEVDPSASWNKLLSVIQSPTVSSDHTYEKGEYICVTRLTATLYCLSCRSRGSLYVLQ